MVTQLLFGDYFAIEEDDNGWVNVKTQFDYYNGWVDKKQFLLIDEAHVDQFNKSNKFFALDLYNKLTFSHKALSICIGSYLPNYNGNFGTLNGDKYVYQGRVISVADVKAQKFIGKIATLYLNTPYMWGGKSPFGIDCSGFTQMVFRLNGIDLRRDSFQQAEQGEQINDFADSQQEDLAFFEDDEGIITHVGILLGGNKIIHASGKVRIDKIDSKGIFNEELEKYTHKLRCVKRMT
ncbi:C40 family peptidase [Candidatus Amoebophilus asiaticus]|nr:C40 family peptidase [Candidatus Amoebophilus asiaticus]